MTDRKVPANSAYVSQIKTAMTTTRMSVYHAGCRPLSLVCPSRYPDRLKLPDCAVDGQRHQHEDERGRDDQRGAHRAADRLADAGGPAAWR